MLTDTDIEIQRWVKQWAPFIKNFGYRLGLKHTDQEDWFQTARTVFWEVRSKFRNGAGKSLDSFILDMLKLRLLDLKRAEANQNRFWLRESVDIDKVSVFLPEQEKRVLELNVSKDSATVLRLIFAGYSKVELHRKLGFPVGVINHAKDEALLQFVKEGDMKLRGFLEERCKELSIQFDGNDDDLGLANKILTIGKTAKRKFKIVPASSGGGDAAATVCKNRSCDNNTVNGLKFCSVVCAEQAFNALNREHKSKKRPFIQSTNGDGEYKGEAGEQEIRDLINPYEKETAAYIIFDLFRLGGTKEILAEKLGQIVQEKDIKCTSPSERVRRVITDTRRLGFEVLKSKGGFFRLTGRKKQ